MPEDWRRFVTDSNAYRMPGPWAPWLPHNALRQGMVNGKLNLMLDILRDDVRWFGMLRKPPTEPAAIYEPGWEVVQEWLDATQEER